MNVIILVLLVLVVLIVTTMCIAYRQKIHLFFPIHFALALITMFISLRWFITGQEFLFSYGNVWEAVKRGSLDALSSVMSIVGVTCLLLGWSYSERDKVTLGKRQIDMIHHILGHGYALSIVTHIATTAGCMIMTKCSAKEAALWAFVTVIWGCIPQALICLYVTLNRKNRENLALKIWKHDGKKTDDGFMVVCSMAKHLGDIDVRHNKEYCKTMSGILISWLRNCNTGEHFCITEDIIKAISALFREFAERIPKEDQILFEEDFLKSACNLLSIEKSDRDKVVLTLLCCGYYRYLYMQAKENIAHRIERAVYYSQQTDYVFKELGGLLKDFNCALQWYQFLMQRNRLPEGISNEGLRAEYISTAFEQLITSLFEDDGENAQKYAQLAWNQMRIVGEEV